jgi:uncharacterized membrane protein YhaH (DUF805 family)
MSLIRSLFSLEGRVSRRRYWNIQIIYIGLFVFAIWLATLQPRDDAPTRQVFMAIGFYGLLAFIFATSFTLGIRRCHDRGKPWVWMLFAVVPFVGLIALFDIWFLAGTRGPNAYGAEPTSRDGTYL